MITAPDGRPLKVVMIAAVSENGVIGVAGDLPWSLPDDLARFQRETRGHAMVMGRKTLDTLPGPLRERINIILTRDRGYARSGVHVVHDLPAAMELAARLTPDNRDRIFIAGGGEVYAAAMPLADELDITRVHATVTGDTRFPSVDPGQWRLATANLHPADPRHLQAFTFEGWVRVGAVLGHER